jgi:hypothetical protein
MGQEGGRQEREEPMELRKKRRKLGVGGHKRGKTKRKVGEENEDWVGNGKSFYMFCSHICIYLELTLNNKGKIL